VGGDSTWAVVHPRWVTLALSIGWHSVADMAQVGNIQRVVVEGAHIADSMVLIGRLCNQP